MLGMEPKVVLSINTPSNVVLGSTDLFKMSIDLDPFASSSGTRKISSIDFSPVIHTNNSVSTSIKLDEASFNSGPSLLVMVTNVEDVTAEVIGPDVSFITNRDVSDIRSGHESPGLTLWSVSSDTIESVDLAGLTDGPDVTSESARDLLDVLTHINLGLEPFSTLWEFTGNTTSEVEFGVTTLEGSEHISSGTHSDGAEFEVGCFVSVVVREIEPFINT
jgi:hypothetical protein